MIKACKKWLDLSFSGVMSAVWIDYPDHEVKEDPITQ